MSVDKDAIAEFIDATGAGAAEAESVPATTAEPVVTAPAPAASAPATPVAPAASTEAPEAIDFEADLPAGDSFDRAYVERLRKEAAERRVNAKPFEEAFAGYDEESKAVLLELATTLQNDPRAGARQMKELAEALLSDVPDPDSDGSESDYMTREDYNAIREQERVSALAEKVENQAVALGYTKGTPAYRNLLLTAQADTGGDLDKAHAALQADRQAIIDTYVAEKGLGPTPPTTGTMNTIGTEREIKTMKDAREATKEYLMANGF